MERYYRVPINNSKTWCTAMGTGIRRSLAREEHLMTLVDVRTPDPKRFIPGATGDWEVIIGMEVHAQVLSNSKLFSGASTEFGKPQNSNVSLVDAAMPGMLPVINEECVAQAVRTGLGLKAQINKRSIFDRKNYFYPDLPQGYQISQFKFPDRRRGRDRSRSGLIARASSKTSRSASSACIWSRMPASRCTTSTRPCPTST
jgi:hypothetical protein